MDPVILRAVERILVVLFAGMAIYLGYRLFLAVPTQQDADGKVVLPGGTEVVLSRVGPGAFFALFGTIALGMSLFYRVEVTPLTMSSQELTVERGYVGLTPTRVEVDPAGEQTRLRALFFTLNELADTSVAEDSAAARQGRDLRQTKVRLLQTVWDEGWGDFRGFAAWANGQDARGEPPDSRYTEPAALFHQGRLP
ncbi:hypothetical protein [Litchfieldella rifensis]|uniref:Uncharacterized protein n=1 Tax=Litchfieldella rifensis TaxID=762643 RepID=A0ABV7LKT5_9GAMM